MPDRTLTRVVVRADTAAFRWRRFVDRHAERREARRRERFEAAQRAYRPPRYHLIERGLLTAVGGIACVMGVHLFGSAVADLFETVSGKL